MPSRSLLGAVSAQFFEICSACAFYTNKKVKKGSGDPQNPVGGSGADLLGLKENTHFLRKVVVLLRENQTPTDSQRALEHKGVVRRKVKNEVGSHFAKGNGKNPDSYLQIEGIERVFPFGDDLLRKRRESLWIQRYDAIIQRYEGLNVSFFC